MFSSMKKYTPIAAYIEKARALKKLGLIDRVPRRENIKPQDKTQIAKLAREYKEVLRNPVNFAIKPVREKTAEVLKQSGYRVAKGKAIIPLADGRDKKFDSVSIDKGTLTFKRPGKTNKIYLSGDAGALMRKAAQLQSTKGRNQTVTFSLRGFAVSSTDYDSFDAMMAYLQNVILPKIVMDARKKARRSKTSFSKADVTADFWSSVSIVTVGDTIAKRKRKN